VSAADFFAGLVTLAGGEFCFDFFLAGLTDLETDFRAALLAGSLIDTVSSTWDLLKGASLAKRGVLVMTMWKRVFWGLGKKNILSGTGGQDKQNRQ